MPRSWVLVGYAVRLAIAERMRVTIWCGRRRTSSAVTTTSSHPASSSTRRRPMSRCHCRVLGAVMVAVVLDGDPQRRVRQVRPGQPRAVHDDVPVGNGSRQPGAHDQQPQPGLHRRVGAWLEQGDRRPHPCRAATSRARRPRGELDQIGPPAPQYGVAEHDQVVEAQPGCEVGPGASPAGDPQTISGHPDVGFDQAAMRTNPTDAWRLGTSCHFERFVQRGSQGTAPTGHRQVAETGRGEVTERGVRQQQGEGTAAQPEAVSHRRGDVHPMEG